MGYSKNIFKYICFRTIDYKDNLLLIYIGRLDGVLENIVFKGQVSF